DVEHGPGYDANQLALWLLNLIVQPAQHAFRGTRMIVLYKRVGDARNLSQPPLVVAFKEESALVSEYFRFKDQESRDFSLDDVHDGIAGFALNVVGNAVRAERGNISCGAEASS